MFPNLLRKRQLSVFKTFNNKIIGLYKSEESSNLTAPAGHQTEEPIAPAARTVEPETRINFIENQTHVRTY